MFSKRLNRSLTPRPRVERVYRLETHRLSEKKKVPDARVCKERHADNLLGHEKLIT